MVAVIRIGRSIRRTFHYNENKVNAGDAALLMAGNYPLELKDMTENHRLNMLLRTAESNSNVVSNSIHISLNFAPGEVLSDDKFRSIAEEYMEQIGFGNQPYLVYRHDDAGHPHIHIATVKVTSDGTRIETQNIGKERSEPARKALEEKYGLVKAEDHKRQVFNLKPIDAKKVMYGKTESKRAIGAVLDSVLNQYKYTSLPELNALLQLYNVRAERGSEDSRSYKLRGLVYRVLDQQGHPVGVPIKASLFHNRPTLAFIEKQFLKNDVARQQHKNKIKSTIDFIIATKQPKSLQELEETLGRNGIKMVLRQSDEGQLYGITYIDFRSKCVFNGSTLGKSYSAKGILERLNIPQGLISTANRITTDSNSIEKPSPQAFESNNKQEGFKSGADIIGADQSLIDTLLQHEYAPNGLPYEWKKRKKRKRKR